MRPSGPPRIELRCAPLPKHEKESISFDVGGLWRASITRDLRINRRRPLRSRPKGSENFSQRLRLKTFRPDR